jgi:hypothetical protein
MEQLAVWFLGCCGRALPGPIPGASGPSRPKGGIAGDARRRSKDGKAGIAGRTKIGAILASRCTV